MRTSSIARSTQTAAVALLAVALAACSATAQKQDTPEPASTSSGKGPAKPVKPAKPAKAETPTSSGGRTVKGRDGWEGSISGSPWNGAKFSRLEIGMSYKQVLNLIGPPTDQYAHVTGKAWIPFYYGSGRYEHKLLYKGQGRLVFAGDAGFSSNAHLIGIEYNRGESGYQ